MIDDGGRNPARPVFPMHISISFNRAFATILTEQVDHLYAASGEFVALIKSEIAKESMLLLGADADCINQCD